MGFLCDVAVYDIPAPKFNAALYDLIYQGWTGINRDTKHFLGKNQTQNCKILLQLPSTKWG
ncbi:MAG TPA: hypothetical protein DEH25_18225 [Chloroflexi bacterium]|nr:hypothetical protein [Chloroflexota bacterium]